MNELKKAQTRARKNDNIECRKHAYYTYFVFTPVFLPCSDPIEKLCCHCHTQNVTEDEKAPISPTVLYICPGKICCLGHARLCADGNNLLISTYDPFYDDVSSSSFSHQMRWLLPSTTTIICVQPNGSAASIAPDRWWKQMAIPWGSLSLRCTWAK